MEGKASLAKTILSRQNDPFVQLSWLVWWLNTRQTKQYPMLRGFSWTIMRHDQSSDRFANGNNAAKIAGHMWPIPVLALTLDPWCRRGRGRGRRRKRWCATGMCWVRSWCAATMSWRCCMRRSGCSSPSSPKATPPTSAHPAHNPSATYRTFLQMPRV